MRAWLIVALAPFAACGSEVAAPTTTESHPACAPRPRICGLAPPQRDTSYKVTTVTGVSFWVTLPAELAHGASVVALPDAPMRVKAELTTAAPRDAADRFCDQFPACEPAAVSRARVPLPLVRWDDASGTIRDLEVTTLDLGTWTLVLAEPDAGRAETVARAVRAEVDADGYPSLSGVDADWASVMLWVRHVFIQVMPGCDLTTKRPYLGDGDAGAWCVDDRYRVDVGFADRPTLELLHEKLRVVAD